MACALINQIFISYDVEGIDDFLSPLFQCLSAYLADISPCMISESTPPVGKNGVGNVLGDVVLDVQLVTSTYWAGNRIRSKSNVNNDAVSSTNTAYILNVTVFEVEKLQYELFFFNFIKHKMTVSF